MCYGSHQITKFRLTTSHDHHVMALLSHGKVHMTQSQYKKHLIKFPKIELTVSNSNFCSTFLKEKKKKKKKGPHSSQQVMLDINILWLIFRKLFLLLKKRILVFMQLKF